jgi:ATP-dependent helicase Lhr and Lhr-like helicase
VQSLPPTFSPATRRWFTESFAAATPVQVDGWREIAAGNHTLLLAPTGSGKTLAAFLSCIDRLLRPRTADAPAGVRVVYLSPLKALAVDVEKNLRAPLAGIARTAALIGQAVHPVRVDVRTGDSPQADRRRFGRDPGDILVTTPESLYLLLTSEARWALRTVETVIVDEIHAVAGTKRGVHLALSLERLGALIAAPPPTVDAPRLVTGVPDPSEMQRAGPQRIGLSATQRPLDTIARFLGGDRPVSIVDASAPAPMDLRVVVPMDDLEAPPPGPEPAVGGGGNAGALGPGAGAGGSSTLSIDRAGVWPAIHQRLLELIRAHRSTIVFCNSRRLCERLAGRLNELAGEPLVSAHHGSVSHQRRLEMEEALKAGRLTCIVATSSLELGIDMGAVDLVVQVESPGAVSRGLQRVGRAGHGVGQTSIGRIFPKFRGDLLEAAAVARGMVLGDIEPTAVPQLCLDVLSQQVVAAVCLDDWPVDQLLQLVRRAAPYRDLSDALLRRVLVMLDHDPGSGLSAPTATARVDAVELRPRIAWDRGTDVVRARRGSRMVALANAGTIPDRGTFAVHAGEGGPRVGELDEEMVYESRKNDVILLGGSSWRVVEIRRDRVLVAPAPGEPGRMPFWRGEGPGRPLGLGRSMGALTREVLERMDRDGAPDAQSWLMDNCRLDPQAASNLTAYLAEQRTHAGAVPTDRCIVVERFRDELGDWRVCILSPFGARVHAPWALALESALGDRTGVEVRTSWSDDGIVLRIVAGDDDPDLDIGADLALALEPDDIEDRVLQQLRQAGVFAARFRECAARALLLARPRPGDRTPLWAQRLRSQQLFAVVGEQADHPIVLETYREVLHDVFDVPALVELMADVRARRVRVDHVETERASPFARGLVFDWIASWLYEGDAPLAERRAQALALDRVLLAELLGVEAVRELLDPNVLDQVEAELQGLASNRRARDADQLADLLRRIGELDRDELAVRTDGDLDSWLERLQRERRATPVRLGGRQVWISADDVGAYRDGLGVPAPAGLPAGAPASAGEALTALLLRFARSHVPFTATEVGRRWSMGVAAVELLLDGLVARGLLVKGQLRPGGWLPDGVPVSEADSSCEWCDPGVLQRLRRRTLVGLRAAVAPVEPDVLARFLAGWQGVSATGRSRSTGSLDRLFEVVVQLEGLAIPFSDLERSVLSARVPGYRPELLDQLCAAGVICWVGRGALGPRDGRIVLCRREHASLLLSGQVEPAPVDPLERAVLAALTGRGASFLSDLQAATGATVSALEAALWSLAWLGLVTNDGVAPLRALGSRRRAAGAAPRAPRLPSRARLAPAGGGRWSAVVHLQQPVGPSARAAAAATMLLERYGLVGRTAATSEGLPGGFGPVFRQLRASEEAGRVRRGWFIDGIDGSQFGLPGAVDRLRDERDRQVGLEQPLICLVLATSDPANPYGALVPWPSGPRPPRRTAGARVVLAAGVAVLAVDGRGVVVWAAEPGSDLLPLAVAALQRSFAAERARSPRFDRVNGAPLAAGAEVALLCQAGFRLDSGRLVLDVPL